MYIESIIGCILIILSINQPCILPMNLSCPPEPYCFNQSQIYATNIIYTCSYPLKIVGKQINIQNCSFSAINISASTININKIFVFGLLFLQYSQNTTFKGNILAKKMIITNNNLPLIINVQSSLTLTNAFIQAEKMFLFSNQLNIINSTLKSSTYPCLYKSFNLETYTTFLQNASSIETLMNTQINILLFSKNNLTINTSIIQTGIIFISASNNIAINFSTINMTGRGCKANTGPGRGLSIQLIDQYCMSGSSSSGYGVISQSKFCSAIIQYFMFLTHSFPYASPGPTMVTGSGGYGYPNDNTLGGSGGGIAFIFTPTNLTITSTYIQAEGSYTSLDKIGTAGSGGTIFIYSNILIGNYFNISTSGGASYNNNGSGAGGIVKISYEQLITDNIDNLWINVSQGYQSNDPNVSLFSNGIFYGLMCPIGHWVYYFGCKPCPAGTYSTIGDSKCRQCPYSSQAAINTSSTGNKQISMCYQIDKSSYSLWIEPGDISFLVIVIYLVCLLIFIIIGVIITNKLQKKKLLLQKQQFNFQDASKDFNQNNIITDKLKSDRNFRLADLMYHIHRISLAGCNSYYSPWKLPQKPPQQIKQYVLKQAFIVFSQKFNKIAKWSTKQKILCIFLKIIYPLYWLYYTFIKKSKYKKILGLFDQIKQFNFINNYDFQDSRLILIKISKNTDYTICYMDFFMYQKADLKYFLLNTSYIIWLSGQGTFLKPFYLCQQDIFLNALFFIINRNVEKLDQVADERQKLLGNLVGQKKRQQNSYLLAHFIKKFNMVSLTVDFSAPEKTFIQNLLHLIAVLQHWNNLLFSKCLVNVNLILLLSQSDKTLQSQHTTITILTNNDIHKFQQFISKIFNLIAQGTLNDIKFGLFIYNPQQQIIHNNQNQKIKITDPQGYITDHIQSQSIGQQINQNQQQLIEKQKLMNKFSIKKSIYRLGQLVRYYLFTHTYTKQNKYLIKFLQSLFILFQTMLVFIWSFKLQFPYVLVNIISPFIGIIWVTSDSYGIGKLFLILNAMNLLNSIVSMIIYLILQPQNLIRTAICQIINIIIIVIIVFIGSRGITSSIKLNAPDMLK